MADITPYYLRYNGRLLAAATVLSNSSLAEDLVAEVWLRAHCQFSREVPEYPYAWLSTVLRNIVIDSYRSHSRQPTLPPAQEIPGPEGPTEIRTLLRICVGRLCVQQRRAFRAVVVKGLSPAEAARELDVTPWAVRGRVRRGTRLLRSCLEAA